MNNPKTPDKNYLLPPVSKKRAGHENKPIYTLVLDMDETLIHFEEVISVYLVYKVETKIGCWERKIFCETLC